MRRRCCSARSARRPRVAGDAGLADVSNTLPSGPNLTTVWPFAASCGYSLRSRSLRPRMSATHTFPSRSDVDLVREYEHAGAEALQELPAASNLFTGASSTRRNCRTATAKRRAAHRVRAAAIGDPHRHAVVVDRDTVQRAPLVPFGELAPRRDALVGIGQVVGRSPVPFPCSSSAPSYCQDKRDDLDWNGLGHGFLLARFHSDSFRNKPATARNSGDTPAPRMSPTFEGNRHERLRNRTRQGDSKGSAHAGQGHESLPAHGGRRRRESGPCRDRQVHEAAGVKIGL